MYITQDFIGFASLDGVVLLWVAGPLVQVGAVLHIAQDLLTLLGHNMADHVKRDVDLGLGGVVCLLIFSLQSYEMLFGFFTSTLNIQLKWVLIRILRI